MAKRRKVINANRARESFPYGQLKAPFSYRSRWQLPLPPLTEQDVQDVAFSEKDFTAMEEALGQPLDDSTRLALKMTCGELIFTVLFRTEVRAEKRYQQALSKELIAIHETVETTLRALDTNPKSSSSLSVTAGIKVHCRQMLMEEWGQTITSMREFKLGLSKIIEDLGQNPEKGADGHYEIKYLLHNLYVIAEFAGASLKINSHSDLLGEVFASKFKATCLVKFCSEVLQKTYEKSPKTLTCYKRSADETDAAMQRLKKLNKDPHKLVPDLEAVRSERVKK